MSSNGSNSTPEVSESFRTRVSARLKSEFNLDRKVKLLTPVQRQLQVWIVMDIIQNICKVLTTSCRLLLLIDDIIVSCYSLSF
mmetsp:Transcript_17434/g.22669  ORF Transcript_17434/g.22669 Transcript_17434/m.22669 type:complete len:83 (+) Transcript_17434:659-907(+)